MLGWIGNVFIVAGLWRMGSKDRRAFLLSIVGESCWIANAHLRGDWALASICLVFCLMAGWNFVKWGRAA